MKVNGVEIPEWIARNNTVEQIEKFMKKTPIKPTNPEVFNIEDHQDPGNWGIMVIHPDGMPQVLSLDGTQEQAEEFAEQILAEHPESHLEIFECWTYNS